MGQGSVPQLISINKKNPILGLEYKKTCSSEVNAFLQDIIHLFIQ